MPFDPDYDRGLQMAQKFNTGANRNPTMYNRILAGLPAAARQGFIENARSSGGSGGKQMGAHRSMRDDYLDGVVARAGMSPEEKHQSMVDAAERAKAASRAETEAEEAIRQTGLKQQEQESWQRGQDYAQDYYAQPRTGITEYQEKFQETDAAGNPIGPLQSYDRRSYKVEAYTDPKTGETRHEVVPKGSPKKRPVDKPVEETNIEEQKEVASQTVQGQANQPTEESRFSNVGEAAYTDSEMGGMAGAVGDDAGYGLTPEQMENLSSPENIMDTLGGIGQQVIGGHAPETPGLDAVGATAEELASGAGRLPDAAAPDDLDATLAEAGVPPEETNIEELLGAVGATPEEIAGLTGQPPEDVRGDMPWTRPVADQPGDEPFPEDLKARVLGGHSKRTDDQWKQSQKHQQREEAIHQRRRSNRAANARARNRAMTPAFQMRRFPNESDAAYAKRYAAGVQAMSGLQGAQLQSQTQLAGLGMQGETQIRIAKIQSDMQRAGLDMQRELQKAGLTQQDIQNKLNMLGQLPPHQIPDALNQIAGEIYGEGQAPSFTDKPTGAQLSNLGEQDFQNSVDQYYPNLDTMLDTASEGIFGTNPDSEGHIGSTMGGIGPFENYDEKAQDFAYNLANLIKGNEINANNIAAVAEYLRRELQGGSQAFLQSQMGQENFFGSDSASAGNRFFQAILSGKLPSMGDVQSIIDYGYN